MARKVSFSSSLIVCLCGILPAAGGAWALHGPILVRIDADASGNTATSISSIEPCRSVALNQTFDVDVLFQSAHGILKFDFAVSFDPAALSVQSVDFELFLASAGGSVSGFHFPAGPGVLRITANDFAGRTGPSGSGALARITFQAIASGTSRIAVVENSSPPYTFYNPIDAFSAAHIIVGGACEDFDGDGFPDLQEIEIGSDHLNSEIAPESLALADPSTGMSPSCEDGFDNDGDGLADGEDGGCGILPPPPSRFRTVIAEGDPSPIGGSFSPVGGQSPYILGFNDNGEVLFWSGVIGGGGEAGLFLAGPRGELVKVVAEGDSTPIGGIFTFISNSILPQLNNRGEVAFHAPVTGGSSTTGIFLFRGGGLSKVVALGDLAPEPPLIPPLDSPDTFSQLGWYDLNDAGVVAFSAIQGKQFVSRGGMYFGFGGSVERTLDGGVDIPEGEIGLLNVAQLNLNNSGQVVFGDLLSIDAPPFSIEGIFLCAGGTCQKVVLEGQAIPGGDWGHFGTTGAGLLDLNDLGQIALEPANIPAGDSLLWSGGLFTPMVAAGDPAPMGGSFDRMSPGRSPLNNAADFIFIGSGDAATPNALDGVWRRSGATLDQLTHEMEPSPIGGAFYTQECMTNNFGQYVLETAVAGGRSSTAIVVTADTLRVAPIQAVFNNQPDLAPPGSFALVAGKDAVFRVYLDLGPGKAPAPAQALLCIDGDVESCPDNQIFGAQGEVFPSDYEFTVADRRAARDSLNVFVRFEAANSLLTPGLHMIDLAVRPMNSSDFEEMSMSFEVLLRENPRFNVFVIPIIIERQIGGNTALIRPEDSPFDPNLEDTKDAPLLARAADFLRSVYPANEETIHLRVTPAVNVGERDSFTIRTLLGVKNYFLENLLTPGTPEASLYAETEPENNFLLAVVNNTLGDINAPLGTTLDGVSLLGFTPSRNSPQGIQPPRVAVTLDRLPSGDPTIGRPNKVLIGTTTAHEVGHILDFGDEYADPSLAQDDINPAHSADRDSDGTAAGYYVVERESAFDVSGIRGALSALDGGQIPPPTNPATLPAFVEVDRTLVPPLPDQDPISMGPIYGYMGGTGRSGEPLGLGASLEGGQDVRAWTRQLNYEYLYRKLTVEPGNRPLRPQALPSRTVVRISGMITTNDQASFEPFLIAQSDQVFPRPQGTQYVIEFRDSGGVLLDTVTFDVSFEMEAAGDGIQNANETYFSFIVDLPPGTKTINLLKLGSTLATFMKSDNTPEVGIDSARWIEDDGALEVAWHGSDLDGDELTYSLIYSPDGAGRLVLASDIVATQAAVPTFGLPLPFEDARVLIIARDGFNSAQADSPITAIFTAKADSNWELYE